MMTIYDSFNQALPSFRPYGSQIETNSKPSGTTTAGCTPPKCGIRIALKHWTDLASGLCLEKHRDYLRGKQLPKALNHIAFKSEADVVKASTLYLAYPVYVAYEQVHQSGAQFDQLTRPQEGPIPASRVDRAYLSGPPSDEESPGNSGNIFAVMEYKRFGSLQYYQFDRGIVTNAEDYERAQREPRFIKAQNDAMTFLQQATHYAWRYKTPFVALCDYKMLILLVMNQAEEHHGGHYTYLTIVENSAKMRKAYLGFLLAARLHAQKNNDWRKSLDGEDLFVKAENWEQEWQSGDAKEKPERKTINLNPIHDTPNSQGSEVSKTEAQND